MNDLSSTLLKSLEKDIGELLLKKLEHNNISSQRASQIARFVLEKLPENLSDEQVRCVIPSLDDEFYELSEVVNKHIIEYESKTKSQFSNELNKLTVEGRFDEADEMMKNYLAKITNTEVAQPI